VAGRGEPKARRAHLKLEASEYGGSTVKWKDAEDIALALMDAHPDVDPLTVRFTDLHKWVVALPGFADDAKGSNEGVLEAIQMKWHEEYQDR
jgi:FeS assembly protein IscX